LVFFKPGLSNIRRDAVDFCCLCAVCWDEDPTLFCFVFFSNLFFFRVLARPKSCRMFQSLYHKFVCRRDIPRECFVLSKRQSDGIKFHCSWISPSRCPPFSPCLFFLSCAAPERTGPVTGPLGPRGSWIVNTTLCYGIRNLSVQFLLSFSPPWVAKRSGFGNMRGDCRYTLISFFFFLCCAHGRRPVRDGVIVGRGNLANDWGVFRLPVLFFFLVRNPSLPLRAQGREPGQLTS